MNIKILNLYKISLKKKLFQKLIQKFPKLFKKFLINN